VSAHFYVWYRIDGDEDACARAILGMMARLGCRTGVTGRLLKKRDEARVWMEVYDDVADPDHFQARLGQAVDEFDIGMFIDGPRHTECFVGDATPQPACAPHP
jgi:hypothetical protein